MVVRCTRRMLALLGKSIEIAEPPPSDGDWYANIVWLERRKCLLLTHAGTLFSVFVPDVRVSQLRPLGQYVVGVVEASLRSEGLPAHALGVLEPAALEVAKTTSRSVLGFMNNMAVHIDYAVASAGGLDRCDACAISRQLNPHPVQPRRLPLPDRPRRRAGRRAPVRVLHSRFAYSERKRRPK